MVFDVLNADHKDKLYPKISDVHAKFIKPKSFFMRNWLFSQLNPLPIR